MQAAFDCLILVVHHCGIVGTRPRGHTSLAGADDAQIRIERDKDGTIKATVEHAKDFEAGAVLASKLDQVELGTDSDGDAITSCVISRRARPAQRNRSSPRYQQLAYDALKRTIKDEGVEVKAESEMAKKGVPIGQRACLSESWRQCFYGLHEAKNQATKRQALFRATLRSGRSQADRARRANMSGCPASQRDIFKTPKCHACHARRPNGIVAVASPVMGR